MSIEPLFMAQSAAQCGGNRDFLNFHFRQNLFSLHLPHIGAFQRRLNREKNRRIEGATRCTSFGARAGLVSAGAT